MIWSNIVSEVLEYKGYTHEQLAEVAGVSRPYITQLGNGKRKTPSYEIGRAIIEQHKDKKQLIKIVEIK